MDTPETTKYDSSADTAAHINRVAELLSAITKRLTQRGVDHDRSKLEPLEKDIFDKVTPKLKGLTYGSEEYRESLRELGPALEHHYKANSHHPEHYVAGIDGMNLLDVIEMLCDWKAAGERHADGNIQKSLKINQERFHISSQLQSILRNTVTNLGW